MLECLYGEARLPDINTVWTNKNAYPHALIRSTINGDSGKPAFATLRISTIPLYFDGSTNSGSYRAVASGSVIRYQFSDSGVWEYVDETVYAVDEKVATNFASALGWTNTDILNADGTLYLAASEPIPVGTAPVLDPLSLFMGWKAGNWVARQRGKKKTPVAYLYNGVGLPDINAVWTDKETYPYASIIRVDAGLEQPGFDGEFYYTLDFADAAPIWDGSKTVWNGPAKLHTFLLTNSDKIATAVGMPIGQWFGGEKNNVGVNGNIAYLLPVTWASVDILNADGTVYLATSDPVPVYE